MVYGDDPRALAERARRRAVGRRRRVPRGRRAWSPRRGGDEDLALLDELSRRARARAARRSRNPNAGEVLVSAAPGWEFADLGRPPPRRRRQPRLARRGRLRGADADGRARRAARVDHRDQGAAPRRTSASRVRPCRLTRRGSTRQLRGPRASTTSACSRRWSACRASSSCPRELRGRAYDDEALPIGAGQTDLAAVHRRAHLPGPRARGRRARARRRHRLGLPGRGARRARGARCTRSSGSRSSPSGRARTLDAAGYARVEVHVGDGDARPARARAVRRDRGRRSGAGAARGALASSSRAGGADRRAARRRSSGTELVRARADAPTGRGARAGCRSGSCR